MNAVIAIAVLIGAIIMVAVILLANHWQKTEPCCCPSHSPWVGSLTWRMGNAITKLCEACAEAKDQYYMSNHNSDKDVLMKLDRRYRKLQVWLNMRAIAQYDKRTTYPLHVEVMQSGRHYLIMMSNRTTIAFPDKWVAINTAIDLYTLEKYDDLDTTLTCTYCLDRDDCSYVDDPYNTNGDCLAVK